MALSPSWAMSGQAIDAIGDPHLSKGFHYRVLTSPLLGLPVAPLVIGRIGLGRGAKGYTRRDVTWVDSHGAILTTPFTVTPDNPVTGYLPLGATCCWAMIDGEASRIVRPIPGPLQPRVPSRIDLPVRTPAGDRFATPATPVVPAPAAVERRVRAHRRGGHPARGRAGGTAQPHALPRLCLTHRAAGGQRQRHRPVGGLAAGGGRRRVRAVPDRPAADRSGCPLPRPGQRARLLPGAGEARGAAAEWDARAPDRGGPVRLPAGQRGGGGGARGQARRGTGAAPRPARQRHQRAAVGADRCRAGAGRGRERLGHLRSADPVRPAAGDGRPGPGPLARSAGRRRRGGLEHRRRRRLRRAGPVQPRLGRDRQGRAHRHTRPVRHLHQARRRSEGRQRERRSGRRSRIPGSWATGRSSWQGWC